MLAIIAVVLVGLYLGLFLGPAQTPKLGLDLRGGTQITLKATPIRGTKVTKGALGQAVDIIRQRVDAAGVGGAEINTQGGTNIVVSAPGVGRDRLKALDQTALLRFRQVLGIAAGTPQPVPTASIAPSSVPSATVTLPAHKTKKQKTSHDAVNPALLAPRASVSPTPTPSVSATGTPAPSNSAAATPTPSPSASQGPVPGAASTNLQTVQALFQTYDCSQNHSPTAGLDNPTDYIVACDKSGATKYLLAPA